MPDGPWGPLDMWCSSAHAKLSLPDLSDWSGEMTTKRGCICLLAALLNVFVYFHIYSNAVQQAGISGDTTVTVGVTHPFRVVAPASIAYSKIKLYVWEGFCSHPIVRVRLVGPEIRVFPPFALDDTNKNEHTYTLEISIQGLSLMLGVYTVEANIIRCSDEARTFTAKQTGDDASSCIATSNWDNVYDVGEGGGSSNGDWRWVHSAKCKQGRRLASECAASGSQPQQEDYMFVEVKGTSEVSYDNLLTFKDRVTVISKPTSLLASSDKTISLFPYFSELSNYELVCWLGDEDAHIYFKAFMDLYPMMGSSGQRPFKFKYIKLTDISDPTEHFSETTYQTFDKCKIMFISYGIDRFEDGISPEEYREEINILMSHIEQSMPKFKYAWILTARSSTMNPSETTSCANGSGYPGRTPDRIHKFNEGIRMIFQGRPPGSLSEPGVHLMDISDISESFWHIIHSAEEDHDGTIVETQVSTAVAMRCLEKISQQVKAWRSINQIGTVKGLSKGGTMIPNSELYKQPYRWGN